MAEKLGENSNKEMAIQESVRMKRLNDQKQYRSILQVQIDQKKVRANQESSFNPPPK